MAGRKNNTPKDETPEARFVRLANQRVDAALKKIELVGKLGAKSYKSSAEQRRKIREVLEEALEKALTGLESQKQETQRFRL